MEASDYTSIREYQQINSKRTSTDSLMNSSYWLCFIHIDLWSFRRSCDSYKLTVGVKRRVSFVLCSCHLVSHDSRLDAEEWPHGHRWDDGSAFLCGTRGDADPTSLCGRTDHKHYP